MLFRSVIEIFTIKMMTNYYRKLSSSPLATNISGANAGTIAITLENAQKEVRSNVLEIGGIEWQVLPPEPRNPDFLVIACNQQCKELWHCEAKIRVAQICSRGINHAFQPYVYCQKLGQVHKHCFNSYNKFAVKFKSEPVCYPIIVNITIEVLWSAHNLLELDADLYVQYNGKGAMVAVNRSFLSAYSNYFRNLFTGDWKEKQDLPVSPAIDGNKPVRQIKEDPDFNLTAFTFMLNSMHIFGPTLLKMIPFPSWAEQDRQTKVALLKLAIKYQLWVLEEYAELALIDMQNLGCTDLMELLELSDQFGLTRLEEHCLQSITASDFCWEITKNCDIRARLRKETRKRLDAKLMGRTPSRRLRAILGAGTPTLVTFDLKTMG